MWKQCVSLCLLSLPLLMAAPSASAHPDHDKVRAEQGWVRWVPPVSPNSAGYMVLNNPSYTERVLVGAKSPVAKAVELHTVVEKNGASAMQKLESLTIPAAGEVAFAPGGNHLMFIGLVAPLEKGQSVPVTFQFKNGETLTVSFPVKTGVVEQGHDHHHHH